MQSTTPSSRPAAASSLATPRKPKPPTTLGFELVEWEGRPYCMYLDDFRIVGGKPWAGGQCQYEWTVKVAQLQGILQAAVARHAEELLCEVYKHPDGKCSVYLDNVLLRSRYARDCREREVGSRLILRKFANTREFARVNEVFKDVG